MCYNENGDNMENKEKMYHIGLSKEEIKNAKYCILTGDPKRVEKIASSLENAKYLGENREYRSYLGEINEEPVLVISSGMGGPAMAICVEELNMLGIETLIRVGTSGVMQLDVQAGDLVVATSAIRQEGTSKEYLPVEYPAVADLSISNALKEASEELGYKTHIGVVHCKDSFYGQHSPERMPVKEELLTKWNAWLKGGCLCSEMETASLFIVSSVLKLKAGAILSVIWNQEREKAGLDQKEIFDNDKEIKTAVLAIKKLMENEHK